MNESGMQLMEWTPEIGRRAEAKRDFVAQTSDLVFRDPSFVIRHAGVYSDSAKPVSWRKPSGIRCSLP